jgi:hypothetical protein
MREPSLNDGRFYRMKIQAAVSRILCSSIFLVACVLWPAEIPEAFYVAHYQYTACNDEVPMRKYPDMFAPRTGTIPLGAAVKADAIKGDGVRMIYKVPQGYYIGWSLTTLLCPIKH